MVKIFQFSNFQTVPFFAFPDGAIVGAIGVGAVGGAKALDAVEDDDRGLDDIDLDEEEEDFTAEIAAGTEADRGAATGGGGRAGGGGGGAGISLPEKLSRACRNTLDKIYVKGEIKNLEDIKNLVEALGSDNFTFEMTDSGFKIRDYSGKIKGGHKPHGENSSVDKSCLKDIKELFESHRVFEHFGITRAIDPEETTTIWRGGAEENSKEPEDGDDIAGFAAVGSCALSAADSPLIGGLPVPDDV